MRIELGSNTFLTCKQCGKKTNLDVIDVFDGEFYCPECITEITEMLWEERGE